MNINDVAKHFTDDVYATKDEVRAHLNKDDISDVFTKILNYRNNFDCEIDLIDESSNHYKICLTRNLLGAAYNLQLKLMEDLYNFSKLTKRGQSTLILDRKLKALNCTLKFDSSSNINNETLLKIAKNEMENISPSLYAISSYSHSFDYCQNQKIVSIKDIENINHVMSGIDFTEDTKFRTSIDNDSSNILSLPSNDKIVPILESFILMLNQKEIPAILKSLISIYVFDYARPFEYFNFETGALVSKTIFSNSGLNIIGYLLDFESITYTRNKALFAKMKEGEKTLDLTYYLNYAMPYLVKEEELLRDEINNQLKIDEDNYNAYIANKPSENNDVIVDDIISDNQALPQFPQSNVENIDELVRKLREVYPDLKKKEAHFYASHCTVGLNYTIEQFKVYENSVYETARYSMDHLAMKGFYRKFKLGNKFVYTPLPRNEDK